MFFSRKQIFCLILISHVVLPLGLLGGLLLLVDKSSLLVIPSMLIINCILLILYKGGWWEYCNYYLRYFFMGLAIVFSLICLFSMKMLPSYSGIEQIIASIEGITFIVLLFYLIRMFQASKKPTKYIKLTFPFKKGRYLITDGGDGKINSLMNYHYRAGIHGENNTNRSMRFATDIAVLDKRGKTVNSVLTGDNRNYKIYHEQVYSPCGGIVIDIVDGIDNNIPFSQKFPYNVGNCIVIQKKENYLVLGHLEKNSIQVKVGDLVHTGQFLGIVGNSGLTPRPHIHMQVSTCKDGHYWQGEGVPIIFNKYFYPIKNKTIKIE